MLITLRSLISQLLSFSFTTFPLPFVNLNFSRNVHMNEAIRMQMEVQRRLHEQLEVINQPRIKVQKHLQMRIEAQGKYMQSILEKAYQTLATGDVAASPTAGYKSLGSHAGVLDVCSIKDIGPASMGFPSLQDLHLYGGGHLDLQQQQPMESFFACSDGGGIGSLGKKRSSQYAGGKSPMMWGDDDDGDEDDKGDQLLQMAPPMMDDIDSMYEAKPMMTMSGDSAGSRGFDGGMGSKLERPSPRRPHMGAQRMGSPSVIYG